jgi:effector-binding domain-containing protein
LSRLACILQKQAAGYSFGAVMESEFRLEHQAPVPTISVRVRASVRELPQRFAQIFADLERYLAENAVAPAGPPFAIYHGFGMAELDVEAGLPTERSLPPKGDIRSAALPEGSIATCVYTGPYRSAGAAYSALSSWMHGQGLTAAGPFSESYLNEPKATPESQLRTRIAVPVEAMESL